MTTELKGKVIEMCNLSSLVEEKGKLEMLLNLYQEGIITLATAVQKANIS